MLRDLKLPEDDKLIVGIATGDDAGVYRLSDDLAIVQTVDFFTPVVDDPYVFGQIAAANSLSDVYAMGGRPITALNLVCYPIAERDPAELAAILQGGADKVAEAGAALAGGHSVDDPEPKYGLAVTGLIDPRRVATNAGARPGDRIVLTKRLGTGIVTTAAKFDECPPETLAAAVRSMSTLNAGAARAMAAVGIGADGVHAATDVTGFGLLGHLWHLARASGVSVELSAASLPALPGVEGLAAGNQTRGQHENEAYLAEAGAVDVDTGIPDWRRSLLYDPQTSGGLAIVVAEPVLPALADALDREGVGVVAVIGQVSAGPPRIRVGH